MHNFCFDTDITLEPKGSTGKGLKIKSVEQCKGQMYMYKDFLSKTHAVFKIPNVPYHPV